jgi:hypothetical protein
MLDVDPFSLPKTVYLFVYLDSLSIFVFALLDQYPSFKHRAIGKANQELKFWAAKLKSVKTD